MTMFAKLLSSLLATACVAAAADQDEITSLRGLHEFAVVVEGVRDNLRHDGLDRDAIKSDVELKLRMAGMKVVTGGSVASLYININTRRSTAEPLYAINGSLQLYQLVRLARDPAITVVAPTWSHSFVGVVGAARIGSVRDQIKSLVDQFITDYLSANPRK